MEDLPLYGECECCHDAVAAVNKRAYTAFQMTEGDK